MANFTEILVLKADRLCAESIAQTAGRAFPEARCRTAHTVAEAAAKLAFCPADLFITGTSLKDGDSIDYVAGFRRGSRPFDKVLVVTTRDEVHLHLMLRALPVDGVFDSSTEDSFRLGQALQELAAGRGYWSQSTAMRLVTQSLSRVLTRRARLILAVIGDGTDDRAAASMLGMTPSSVQSARRMLHRKLGVQHRSELFRWALQHGFVRLASEGVRRPGLAMLKTRGGSAASLGACVA